MIAFLIKSTICLALLYAFYVAFLENRKMHRFNRFYLLGILPMSIFIPNYIINLESSIVSPVNTFTEVTTSSFRLAEYMYPIMTVYLLITSILLFRFVGNVFTIIKGIRQNRKIQSNDAVLVLMEEKVLPHTFLHYIFLNKDDYEKQKIKDELVTHELTHVMEKHTMDVLFMELFQIVFWFNPVVYSIKKSIRLNHEFIADETVINTHKNTSGYQHILLEIATWNNGNGLTSNLNYALTKKRFHMMAKKSSDFAKNMTKLSIIPLLVIVVFLFANIVAPEEHSGEEHQKESSEIVSEEGHHANERLEENHHDGEDHKNGNTEVGHED